MLTLTDNIILEIWEWIFSNKDMVALISSCKHFQYMGKKHGFIRHLNLSMNSDYMNLIVLWRHCNLKSLRSVNVSGLNSPANWLPFAWPKHTTFSSCRMGISLISPEVSMTTHLNISDSTRGILLLDWSKLPKLRSLKLNVYDVEFSGLVKCQSLEHVHINLKNNRKKLPGWISDLRNLITIRSNLIPETSMHFVSTKLKRCLIPKRKRVNKRGYAWLLPDPCTCGSPFCIDPYKNSPYEHFTAESTSVPWRHLLCNDYIY